MDIQKTLALYDREQRIELIEPGMTTEITPEVVRAINRLTEGAWVCYSWLTPENIDRVITEQIAYFEHMGRDFEWKVYSHDWPPDLKERLVARGFSMDEEEAIMAVDLEEAPPELFALPHSDVRLLSSPAELDAMLEVQREVWGRDFGWLRDELAHLMEISPDFVHIYAVYADGRPVSSAWVRFHAGSSFASLWGGSTVAGYRGRGFYRDLLAARAIEARQRGFRYLTLDASPMSRAIVQKLGFQLLCTAYACECSVRRGRQANPGEPPAAS